MKLVKNSQKQKEGKRKMKRILSVLLIAAMLLSLAACGGGTSEQAASPAKEETASVSLSPAEGILLEGETLQLSAEGSGSGFVWTSSDPAVASVSEDGLVTAVSAGEATITVSLSGNEAATASAAIQVGRHVSALEAGQKEVTLLLGTDQAELAADVTVVPDDAAYREVAWESSDPSVVTVDASGSLHAVAAGSAVVTARTTEPGADISTDISVTVLQGVTSISLSETELMLPAKATQALALSVLPEDAEDRTVTWSSSDENVATVDSAGKVTAVGGGTASITATANDGGRASASCAVTVVVSIKSMKMTEAKGAVLQGGPEELTHLQLEYAVTPEDATYRGAVWSSSNEAVATVDENGVVTAVAPGTAVITAVSDDPTANGKVKTTCTITVGAAIQDLALADTPARLEKGKSVRIGVTLTPAKVYNSKLSWVSSNENVVTVDANGTVRGTGVGEATVTCTTTDGTNLSATKSFTVYQPVTSLKASDSKVLLFAGQTKTVSAAAMPEDATDKSVTWSSSKDSVATVSEDGTIRAVGQGTAVITATAKDGSNRTCKIAVTVEPALPITVTSLGFGIYNGNLLGITVQNYCKTLAIRNFDFDIVLYDYLNQRLNTSGSYSLGSDETIPAGGSKTIKRTMSGVSQSSKVVITITGVVFYDGTYYTIPASQRETWTFSR